MTAGAQKSSHDRVGSSWVGFYIGLQNPHGLAMTGVFATQRSTAITARYMDTAGWGLVPRLYRSVQVVSCVRFQSPPLHSAPGDAVINHMIVSPVG